MVTKITRSGYSISKDVLTKTQLQDLRDELSVKPAQMKSFGKRNTKPIITYKETTNFMIAPRFYGTEKYGIPDKNFLDKQYPPQNMVYTGTLRPNQQIIVDKVHRNIAENGGGLLIAGCGSGKTNMAIYLACMFNIKTLIIVHKTFLKNQAIDRILSNTNQTHVGVLQRKTIDTDHPFVVGMVHSICSINYDPAIFAGFGMVIIDEVHHMAAPNFSQVFRKVGSKYMLGISAEYTRTDKTYCIINWNMGPILHLEEQKPNDMVIVKQLVYHTGSTDLMEDVINKYTGEHDRSTMISNLVKIPRRDQFIVNLINGLLDLGKNILCLTGRIKQVENLYDTLQLDPYIVGNVGKYLGGMNEKDLDESANKQVIIGTFSMAEEGLDIDNLNVVILCTPKSKIKQSIGRILRKAVYEEHPIVIDIIDINNSIFARQAGVREKYYRSQQYNIQSFNCSDNRDQDCVSWQDLDAINKILIQPPIKEDVEEYDPNDIDFLE
jgi:superfamily II DNA or RNA helicase